MKTKDSKGLLKEGMWVRTNGDGRYSTVNFLEGEIGEITPIEFYIWQNEKDGQKGLISPKKYAYSWRVSFSGESEVEILKGGEKMKTVWQILVIDKTKNEIKVNEIVVDGDEKSACAKISISFADKLKDLVFDNLHYIATKLGSYEEKDK